MALLRLRGRTLSTLLLVLGLGLLVYVGLEYASMFREQRRLAREWEHQQLNPPVPGVPGDTLTRLTIPKIDLDSVVVEGTDRKALRLGPGHMEDTATPGETGNSVITAHRDTFFRHLNDLQMGDEVLVERGGKVFHYQVTGKRVVPPTDLSVIAPTKDTEITLITCYPFNYVGPAPRRFVVRAREIGPAL